MRRLDVAALTAVAVLLAGAFVYGQRDPEPAGRPAGPDLTALREQAALEPCPEGIDLGLDLALPCLGGGPDVPLDRPAAGPSVVNVWGTWCAPCREEVPDLVAFADKAAGRVGVVGVLTTDSSASGLSFADDYGIRYPNLVDDDGLVRGRFGAGAPLTLFVTADGTVAHVESGRVESLAELEGLTARHLGVRL